MATCFFFLQGAVNHLLYLAYTPFPLDLAYLDRWSVIVAIQFTTNEKLKDLTQAFYFQIPCYKLYKESLFSYVLILKYMCHFGTSLKKLNLKAKHKILKINYDYVLVHLVLNFLTYILTQVNK
jgi:hypothetical protein